MTEAELDELICVFMSGMSEEEAAEVLAELEVELTRAGLEKITLADLADLGVRFK